MIGKRAPFSDRSGALGDVLRGFGFLLAAVLMLCPVGVAQAAPGLLTLSQQTDYASGELEMRVEDLRVKVQGGAVRILRTWTADGWEWNRRWNALELFGVEEETVEGPPLGSGSNPGGSGGSQFAVQIPNLPYGVIRNGSAYVWDLVPTHVSHLLADERTFVNGPTKRIDLKDGLYQWHDRLGNTLTYGGAVFDADPSESGFEPRVHLLSYSDADGNTVSLGRDAQGRVSTVSAPGVGVVVTFTYAGDVLDKVTDYSGRVVDYHYDAQGKLTGVTDVRGQDWAYTYHPSGQIAGVVDPTGHTVHLDVNGDGVLASAIGDDGIGQSYTYDYSQAQDQYYTRQVDSTGTVTEQWANALGHTARVDVNGETLYTAETILSDNSTDVRKLVEDNFARNTFSSTGSSRHALAFVPPAENRELVYIKTRILTDARGEVTRYDYDQWQNVVRTTFPDGGVETRTYHARYNLPTRIVAEDGTITELAYDAAGNLVRLIEAKGLPEERITEYAYDAHGNLTQVKVLGDANTKESVSRFTFDAYGNVETYTDAEGSLTQFTAHDVLGNVLTRIDARGKTWRSTYDAVGNLLSDTDPDNRMQRYVYDDAGNLVKFIAADATESAMTYQGRLLEMLVEPAVKGTPTDTSPDGYATAFEYDAAGHPVRIVDPTGRERRIQYDVYGRIKANIDGNGNATRFEYANHRLESILYPGAETHFEFDNRDALVSSTVIADGTERQRRRIYDRDRRITTFTDAEDRRTAEHTDALGRLTLSVNAEGGELRYAYDDRDNLILFTDPEGRTTTFEYDRNNRLIAQIKEQHGERTTYRYNATGNLAAVLSAEGQLSTFTYSGAGRLTKREYFTDEAAPVAQKTVSYDYDTVGLLSGYDDATTAATYEYDATGRLTSVSVDYGPFTKTYGYSYYPNGLKASYTTPEGITYEYTYDKNGQFESMTIPGEGLLSVNTYRWRAPTELTFPGGASRIMVYDDTLRLTEAVYRDPGQNDQQTLRYVYDREDNVTTRTTEHGEYNYTYNVLYQLTGVVGPQSTEDEHYTYDGVGNRLSTATSTAEWNYNANNQLTEANGVSYFYDADGNLIEKSMAGESTYFLYNLDQRLRRVEDASHTPIAEYTYDPFGRRLSKTVAGETRYFLYNQEGLVAEYAATGALLKEYQYAPASGWMTNPLFLREGGETYYYHNDHLGTPQAIYNQAGALVWSARYTAFGEADILTASVTNNLRFPGQYFDAETRLHYNYFRDYDPSTGRYITSDPIGLGGGINTYGYVGGNPLRFFDFTGLTKLEFVVDEGRLIVDPERKGEKPYEIDVTSGRGKCQNNSSCERTPNEGPIPRGEYYVDSRQIDDPSFIDDIRRNFFDERNEGGGDWGDWRTRIYPYPGTERFGRTGFYLHGGYLDGSAGCVDFGGGPFGNDKLLEDLLADPDRIIPLTVR